VTLVLSKNKEKRRGVVLMNEHKEVYFPGIFPEIPTKKEMEDFLNEDAKEEKNNPKEKIIEIFLERLHNVPFKLGF